GRFDRCHLCAGGGPRSRTAEPGARAASVAALGCHPDAWCGAAGGAETGVSFQAQSRRRALNSYIKETGQCLLPESKPAADGSENSAVKSLRPCRRRWWPVSSFQKKTDAYGWSNSMRMA